MSNSRDSPMVDEMFDSSQMEVNDSEDSILMGSGHGSGLSGATGANGSQGSMGPGSSLMSELSSSDRTVHADFFNKFGDLFNDKDLD